MTDLSEHDAQLLRSAQQALEDFAKVLLAKAAEKDKSAGLSSYAAGWRDACDWASAEAETRAKALGSLR